MSVDTFSLFPLNTVLFPDGPLPLRIFETRYLDMISRCMKEDQPFGVLLMASGSELGDATMVKIGTRARITDWYQGSDGILGITAVGMTRFRLLSMSKQSDGLYIGEVEDLAEEVHKPLPNDFKMMSSLLEIVVDDLGKLYADLEKNYDDASWVGRRFAEILPISMEDKQTCLEMNDPIARLEFIRPLLRAIRQETAQ